MKRHILITAGQTYGKLDDNKLVGNRSRGIWAIELAIFLKNENNHITVLVPDIFNEDKVRLLLSKNIDVIRHKGYDDYKEICYQYAEQVDTAIMASAVVNWIPQNPISGKMETKGYREGDVLNIPFVLAPRVINRMKEKAKKPITLIGCKMTSGSSVEETVKQAYKTLIDARCNVVLANDLQNLKHKMLVFPDGSVHHYENDFGNLFNDLQNIIEDEHYSTDLMKRNPFQSYSSFEKEYLKAKDKFSFILEKYKKRFVKRADGENRVFGSIVVQIGKFGCDENYYPYYLSSPREKGEEFGVEDAVICYDYPKNKYHMQNEIVVFQGKASLNAPLLIRHLKRHNAETVLHLHEELSGVPFVDYAPPGTVRDNHRDTPHISYNIKNHGFVAILDERFNIVK